MAASQGGQWVQPSWGSARSVDEYDRASFVQIGEGTYGQARLCSARAGAHLLIRFRRSTRRATVLRVKLWRSRRSGWCVRSVCARVTCL
jgi:hypothetical protein